MSSSPPPYLNTPKHTQYFLRCLKTHLPTHYQSSESQRLSFAFFTLSALDLLGTLHTKTTPAEREEWATWLYGLQHPCGGWKGFTGASVGGAVENLWDPANLGATFMALGALIVLGDSMERVRRRECLEWLRGLQREEGSFGEARGKKGRIEGGGDVRFGYLAAGVRWMLRRGEEGERVKDIDTEALVGFVRRSVGTNLQTFEGGIAEIPGHEAHAGETFCGIAVLKLLGRLPSSPSNAKRLNIEEEDFVEHVTRWLVYRQTLQMLENEEDDDDNDNIAADIEKDQSHSMAFTPGFQVQGSHPEKVLTPPQPPSIEPSPKQLLWVGFNGRCNKVADTCYAWWVGGSLAMLHQHHLQDFNAVERYLLENVQHRIGGFSKMPGDPPAALAAMKHPDLKSIDSRLCMSISALEYFELETALGRGEALESEMVIE